MRRCKLLQYVESARNVHASIAVVVVNVENEDFSRLLDLLKIHQM
jgi:hypothetical protein